ncbi:MAG: DNA repair and recombination protein RadA [Candidatus Aenigmarchaeota archaeon]|nr:DNA repair and recombination protein RadA [Candidatus Aenigmarchaeota archaeon]
MAKKKITNVSDLPGVGEKIGQKLKAAGYIDMMSIAAASPKELGDTANVGELTATKIINTAREELDIGFETGKEVDDKRLQIRKISTGSENLDKLLEGGIETQSVTEFHGAFGSGKTQVGFQIAVNAQKPIDEGGVAGNVIILDAENTFRPERIRQIAEAEGMDADKVLENIFVARCYNSDHQMVLAEHVGEMIKEKNVKLVIVDSVTSNFRADFSGRGELASRQQKLNRHLHTLQRLADVYNVAVYITNQVMANPAILFGDPTRPIGGHILGHFSTHRLYVRKSKGNTRIARIVDSPNLPEGEAVYIITPDGIKDPEEK